MKLRKLLAQPVYWLPLLAFVMITLFHYGDVLGWIDVETEYLFTVTRILFLVPFVWLGFN